IHTIVLKLRFQLNKAQLQMIHTISSYLPYYFVYRFISKNMQKYKIFMDFSTKVVSLPTKQFFKMLVFTEKDNLRKHLEPLQKKGISIGFVPTMGALHQGHLSLLKQSLQDNQTTIISIFVNPTQFNNPEDLEKYPRTLDSDIKKVETLSKDIIVFSPTVDDIYEGKTISKHFNFDGLENQMEGKHRPGHFDGVGTIVKKLFEIVQPNKAYF